MKVKLLVDRGLETEMGMARHETTLSREQRWAFISSSHQS